MAQVTEGNKLGQITLSPAEQAAALLSTIAACAILASVLVFSSCGFDLTDEGYYFLSMENSRHAVASITQFGFVYRPLYVLMHGSVALVRMVNYSTTFGLAWILCLVLFKQRFGGGGFARGKIAFSLAITAAFASASLLVSSFELPQSPSYNTLAFQAILIGIIGLLLADSDEPRQLLFGHLLIGLSWWLSFMAKPTTAAGLGLLGLIYLIILGRFRLRLFAGSIITAALLLLLSAWMIDGSLSAFIQGYLTSLQISSKLAGSNLLSSIWGWDLFPLAGGAFWSLMAASIILSVLVLLGASENRRMRRIGLGLSIALSLTAIGIAAWGVRLARLSNAMMHCSCWLCRLPA